MRSATNEVRLSAAVEVGGGDARENPIDDDDENVGRRGDRRQIGALEEAGCEIVRVAVSDEADAAAVRAVKERISLPLVADIHFSPKLAVAAIENGADKVRINPGNIGGEKEIKYVADCIRAHRIPVRVGSNTGSIEPHFFQKYGRSAEALVESALYNVGLLEKFGVEDIVISVKASSVPLTVRAYTPVAERTAYPLHVGVTEAGTDGSGHRQERRRDRRAALEGIGDTIRVSLTDDPVQEVYAAKHILRACGLEERFVEVVSCPTCGRCAWESMGLAKKVAEFVKPYSEKGKGRRDGVRGKRPRRSEGRGYGNRGRKGVLPVVQKGRAL